jgi:osmotically-inducible protein OsmY
MADRNFYQGNQSHQSNQDWERERNRSFQENEWPSQQYGNAGYGDQRNRGMNEGFRDVGYGGDSAYGMRQGSQEGYRRTTYIPDNDENRGFYNRDYENTKYGASGTYGYRGERDEYGNQYSGDWNRRRMAQNRGGMQNMSYGTIYGGNVERREQETNRAQSDLQRRRGMMRGNRADYDMDYNTGGYGMMSDEGSFGSTMEDRRRDWGRRNIGAYSSDYGRNDYEMNYGRGNRDYDYVGEYGSSYGTSGGYGGMSNDYNQTRGGNLQTSKNYGVSHRGKGPSGYHRSENRIQEDVCDRLTDDDRIDASDIRVQIDSDTVILSGTVRSRDEKRRAEDLAESISGVRDVENRLHVGRPGDMASRDYTGNTDLPGGIGTESGTMNEVIRDTNTARGKNRKV